jgi:2-succinyl-5-enolpyruvyl-6-hydroxy-3-cyclohexene-1-carboxylate synthase
MARVPMIVCTADRPPELLDVGAPQTIDQTGLYGTSPRWFADPGVADADAAPTWRSLAARAVVAATGAPPGPVHLNLPFREPLLAEAGEVPPGRGGGRPWVVAAGVPSVQTVSVPAATRLLVVGGRALDPAVAASGWPVLADVTAGLSGHGVVAHADPILRDPATADRLTPDVVLRVGRPPASRVVNEWLSRTGAEEWVVSDRWSDPSATAAHVAATGATVELPPADPAYLAAWRAADDAAEAAISGVLGETAMATEPATARDVVGALPDGAHLVVASSMPVRDVEWYAPRRAGITVHANRGANGIDGTTSTAVGCARATGAPTVVLLGDIAFLHDSTALVGLRDRGVDVTIVVVDNDGGGIFSFLPQADALDGSRFEQLFGTPHGVDVAAVAEAYGISAVVISDAAGVAPAVRSAAARGGASVVIVRTERAANVAVHGELNAAVAKALAALSSDE